MLAPACIALVLLLEAFECNKTSDWLITCIRFSQSEVVLHSNLQILKKKTKNVPKNGFGEYRPWVRTTDS